MVKYALFPLFLFLAAAKLLGYTEWAWVWIAAPLWGFFLLYGIFVWSLMVYHDHMMKNNPEYRLFYALSKMGIPVTQVESDNTGVE